MRGLVYVVVGVLVIAPIALGFWWGARMWLQRRLLKTYPEALEKRGWLDRQVVIEIVKARRERDAALRALLEAEPALTMLVTVMEPGALELNDQAVVFGALNTVRTTIRAQPQLKSE